MEYNIPLVHWTHEWLPHTGTLTWKPSQGTKLYCLVNRGTLVRTTCPRSLPDNAAAGIEHMTCRSRVQRPNHYTTKPPLSSNMGSGFPLKVCKYLQKPRQIQQKAGSSRHTLHSFPTAFLWGHCFGTFYYTWKTYRLENTFGMYNLCVSWLGSVIVFVSCGCPEPADTAGT